MTPLLVQPQLAAASQSALLMVRMTQAVLGSAEGTGSHPGQEPAGGDGLGSRRWAELPPARPAPRPVGTAGPVELVEGRWNTLGIAAAHSPSSKPAFVPKHTRAVAVISPCSVTGCVYLI